jgi:hypothetical protein
MDNEKAVIFSFAEPVESVGWVVGTPVGTVLGVEVGKTEAPAEDGCEVDEAAEGGVVTTDDGSFVDAAAEGATVAAADGAGVTIEVGILVFTEIGCTVFIVCLNVGI